MPGNLTVRDWFAGQALMGNLAAMNPGFVDASMAEQVAKSAFMVADAMLKERGNG